MLKKYIHIRFQKRNGYAWADKSDFKAIPVEESFEKKCKTLSRLDFFYFQAWVENSTSSPYILLLQIIPILNHSLSFLLRIILLTIKTCF